MTDSLTRRTNTAYTKARNWAWHCAISLYLRPGGLTAKVGPGKQVNFGAYYLYLKKENTLKFDISTVQSTVHELIAARNASLTAMQGSASGSNVLCYPT
jgi:hypothetical protein